MIDLLLTNGAKVDPVSAVLSGRNAVLAEALKSSPNLARSNSLGSPLVFHAAQRGHVQCLALLLKSGADPNAVSRNHSCLFAALIGGHADGADILRQHGARLNVFDAASLEDVKSLKEIVGAAPGTVREVGVEGLTPLHEAARSNRMDCARFLLEHGANPSAQDRVGIAPLHIAACLGHEEIVRLLVEHKADVHARAVMARKEGERGPAFVQTGNTALHFAAQTGRLKIIEFLLLHGADRNATNTLGRTPLFLAQQLAVTPEYAPMLLRSPFRAIGPRGFPGAPGMGRPGSNGSQITFQETVLPPGRATNEVVKEAIQKVLAEAEGVRP